MRDRRNASARSACFASSWASLAGSGSLRARYCNDPEQGGGQLLQRHPGPWHRDKGRARANLGEIIIVALCVCLEDFLAFVDGLDALDRATDSLADLARALDIALERPAGLETRGAELAVVQAAQGLAVAGEAPGREVLEDLIEGGLGVRVCLEGGEADIEGADELLQGGAKIGSPALERGERCTVEGPVLGSHTGHSSVWGAHWSSACSASAFAPTSDSLRADSDGRVDAGRVPRRRQQRGSGQRAREMRCSYSSESAARRSLTAYAVASRGGPPPECANARGACD